MATKKKNKLRIIPLVDLKKLENMTVLEYGDNISIDCGLKF